MPGVALLLILQCKVNNNFIKNLTFMLILEFKTDNLVKEAMLLGEYVASKQADSAEGFFRLAPCCSD